MGALRFILPLMLIAALGFLYIDHKRIRAELTLSAQNLAATLTANENNLDTIKRLQARHNLSLENIVVNARRKEAIPEIRYVQAACDDAVVHTFDSLREAQALHLGPDGVPDPPNPPGLPD